MVFILYRISRGGVIGNVRQTLNPGWIPRMGKRRRYQMFFVESRVRDTKNRGKDFSVFMDVR